jgi:hypothetical protein
MTELPGMPFAKDFRAVVKFTIAINILRSAIQALWNF